MFCISSLKKALVFCCFVVGWIVQLEAFESGNLLGAWETNYDQFARLEIAGTGDQLQVRAYQRCGDDFCFWSEANVKEWTVASEVIAIDAPYHAAFYQASGQFEMTFIPRGNVLEVTIKSETFDHEGPHYQELTLRYYKSQPTGLQSSASTGAIYGKPQGAAQSTASMFHVSLYGPNESTTFISTQSLFGGYHFEGLADGIYWLSVEPRAETAVVPSTNRQLIRIENGAVVEFDVSLD